MKVPQYVKLMKDGKYEFCSDHPIDDGKTVAVFDCKHSEKPLHESALCKKPTRTEYVNAGFDKASDAVKAWEEGDELFVKNPLVSSQEYLAAGFSSLRFPQKIYRRIEKEVDWRDELKDYFVEYENPIHGGEYRIDADEFLEMCRVALRANGELK